MAEPCLRTHRLGAALFAALLLAGCTVGPEHVRPEVPLPERFDQALEAGQDAVPSRLWSSLADPRLDLLLARALEANTSLAQATARLGEARALAGLTVYSLFPTVTAGASGQRNRPSGRDPFIPPDAARQTDTYRAGFDASWEIDLFGSLRNPARAIRRRAEAEEARFAAVRLSVVAEVAQSYFALLGAGEMLALRQRQLHNQEASLRLVERLHASGRVSRLELARAESALRAVAALLPQAELERTRHEQRLAVLTAWPVATVREKLGEPVALPELPVLETVGRPEEWLLRRPDLREAERRLAAARADVGQETAQYFPILTLLGDFGWTATALGRLGNADAERWSFGPTLSWRFLDFGRVRQNVAAARARADGAEAAYREAVLRALEDVETALARLRSANRSGVELAAAREAATEAARIARLRFEHGATDYLGVLDAEGNLLEVEASALQSRIDQATALVAVYKALAGDFAAAAPPPEAAPEAARSRKGPEGGDPAGSGGRDADPVAPELLGPVEAGVGPVDPAAQVLAPAEVHRGDADADADPVQPAARSVRKIQS
ncbi:MAG: multidrug efflux system outer membrane protein [Lysobacteraceae bacterium]|nr:MAG: multidrug efflux system outer membrane protein [Xanthomonadaceae bacterium]